MLNRKEAMQVLLEAGADILQRNRQGWFPDHEARCDTHCYPAFFCCLLTRSSSCRRPYGTRASRSVGDREALLMLHRHKRNQLEKYFSERAGPLMAQLAEVRRVYATCYPASCCSDILLLRVLCASTLSWTISTWKCAGTLARGCRLSPTSAHRTRTASRRRWAAGDFWATVLPMLTDSKLCAVWCCARLQGSSLRVDTTLIGFENLKWQRGDISYLFHPDGKGQLLDHVTHSLIVGLPSDFG